MRKSTYSYLITSSASLVSAMDNYNNMASIVYIICIASFLGHGHSNARGGRAAITFSLETRYGYGWNNQGADRLVDCDKQEAWLPQSNASSVCTWAYCWRIIMSNNSTLPLEVWGQDNL